MLDLIVISRHGIPLVVKKFSPEIDEKMVDAHISLFAAIDAYARSEIKASLEEIKMKGKIIRIEKVKDFSIILVSRKTLPFVDALRRALGMFLKKYETFSDIQLQC